MIDQTLSSSQIDSTTKTTSSLEQVNYLKEKIDNAIKKLRQSRDQNKKRSAYIKIAGILFTGLATLLLGLQIKDYAEIQKEAAFALASLATLLAALEPFFNYRALWVEHEIAQWKMHVLQDDFEYYLSKFGTENAKSEDLDLFQKRYIEIWNTLSESWIQNRRRAE